VDVVAPEQEGHPFVRGGADRLPSRVKPDAPTRFVWRRHQLPDRLKDGCDLLVVLYDTLLKARQFLGEFPMSAEQHSSATR